MMSPVYVQGKMVSSKPGLTTICVGRTGAADGDEEMGAELAEGVVEDTELMVLDSCEEVDDGENVELADDESEELDKPEDVEDELVEAAAELVVLEIEDDELLELAVLED